MPMGMKLSSIRSNPCSEADCLGIKHLIHDVIMPLLDNMDHGHGSQDEESTDQMKQQAHSPCHEKHTVLTE